MYNELMESFNYHPGENERPLSRDRPLISPEEIALRALVDKLFEESDKQIFAIFERIRQSTIEQE